MIVNHETRYTVTLNNDEVMDIINEINEVFNKSVKASINPDFMKNVLLFKDLLVKEISK